MNTTAGPTDALNYATPGPASRLVWPSLVLALLSLGLIGLAGCFLIGVGLSLDVIGLVPATPHLWGPGQYTYVGVLYVFTFVTFAGGIYTAVLAVRSIQATV